MEVVRRLPLGKRKASRTAFVLGGGGNLGAMQVGMLQALLERGITPDLVVGCSAGAINGAAVAHDPTLACITLLEDRWRALTTEQVCPSGRLSGPWSLVKKGEALYPNDGIRKLIYDVLGDTKFEDLLVPFQCVATSLHDELDHWFSSGPLVDAILASAALPGVFPPVTINGVRYMDGGVVDNVPLRRAIELGAERIYVLHVGHFRRSRPDPKRPVDVLLHAFSIGRGFRFHLDMRTLPQGVQVIVMPAVAPSTKLRYDDFDHCGDLIAPAHAAAAAHLDELAAVAAH